MFNAAHAGAICHRLAPITTTTRWTPILPAGGQGVQCGGEDVSRLLDDNMIASTDVRLVTQLTAHAGARRPTRGRNSSPTPAAYATQPRSFMANPACQIFVTCRILLSPSNSMT